MNDNDIYSTIGANLKNNRESLGLSIDEIARRSNLSKDTIVRIEKGKANPKFYTLCKISKALKIKLYELLKGC